MTTLARASATKAMPATIAEIFDIGFDPSALLAWLAYASSCLCSFHPPFGRPEVVFPSTLSPNVLLVTVLGPCGGTSSPEQSSFGYPPPERLADRSNLLPGSLAYYSCPRDLL